MSKTFVYCLIVIVVYLLVVKPINKKEVKEPEIQAGGNTGGGFRESSSTSPTNPVYTI